MQTNPAPLAQTLASLRTGETKLTDYVRTICDRIDEVEPHVEALLGEEDRRARLLTDAAQLDARFPDTTDRPPLYGTLLGVKDIFHVDGFATRAGSNVPPELLAGDEATCVTQLRAAGALIVGKTVTTEFAYFDPGPTRNPHNLAHTPGGSSSGSAAAVSAGLCTLAIGTQTIGSVIRPAAFCGIVGFKPTYERIASTGLLYFSRTVDHVGLFTQDVDGMIVAAGVLCKEWHGDVVDAIPMKLPVLGVPDGAFLDQTEPAALQKFEDALGQLQDAGYVVKRVPIFEDIEALNLLHRRLSFAEFAQEHAEKFATHGHLYREHTTEIIKIGQMVDATELAAARKNCGTLRSQIEEQMGDAEIDLWVSPPAPGPAPLGIHATGNPDMNLPWTHVGMPTTTVPTAQEIGGLPLGIQLTGRFGEDEQLLAWTRQVERMFVA